MFSSSIVIDQITKLYLEAVFQSNDVDWQTNRTVYGRRQIKYTMGDL